MNLPPLSQQFPNTITITQIRQDIDLLTRALDQYGQVNVLKGQKILFKAIDPDFEEERQEKIARAVEDIKRMAKEMTREYPRKRGQKSLTQILIEERDKMRSGAYEL